jgi:hypothetical protein
MKKHKCEPHSTCICCKSALEPNDYCPIHGSCDNNKCKHCGGFMKKKDINEFWKEYNKL